MSIVRIVVGSIIHSKSFGKAEYLRDTAIGMKADGTIMFVSKKPEGNLIKENPQAEIIQLGKNEALIPGFIDTHLHAPQFYFLGLGTDLPLMQWLEKYTFPCEAKFSNTELAKSVFSAAINRCLRNGTTTGCYYGTIHYQACQ